MKITLLVSAFVLALFSCSPDPGGTNTAVAENLDTLSGEAWRALAQKRIYIGHRSVGYNILQGVEELAGTDPGTDLKIVHPGTDASAEGNGIFHSLVKQNASPGEIAADYVSLKDSWLGNNVDIAFIRFTPYYGEDSLDTIMADYEQAMDLLKGGYPDTVFIHGTFPLSHVRITVKTMIKRLLGRKNLWEYGDIVATDGFNERLRDRFSGKEPFFDLAALESTFPDGRQSLVKIDGKEYPHLVSAYTDDNVHLNEQGRRWIASRFLQLLVSLLEP